MNSPGLLLQEFLLRNVSPSIDGGLQLAYDDLQLVAVIYLGK